MEQEMLNKRMIIINNLKEEMKRVKALYDEALEENDDYAEVQEEEKKIKETIKEKKKEVKEEPQLKAMQEELKEIRSDLRDNKKALSQELAEYYKDSGSLIITDPEGNEKRIEFTARLKKV